MSYKYNNTFRVNKKQDIFSEELVSWEISRKLETIKATRERIETLQMYADTLQQGIDDLLSVYEYNSEWTDLQRELLKSNLKVQDIDCAITKDNILQDSQHYWRKNKQGKRIVFEVKSFNETRPNKVDESRNMQKQILSVLDNGIGTWADVKNDTANKRMHSARFRRNALMQLETHRANKEDYIVILESTELTSSELPLYCAYMFDFDTNEFKRLKKDITIDEYLYLSDVVRKAVIKKDNGELYIQTFSKAELTSLFNHIYDNYAK